MYAPSQWETALQCYAISHWLGAYTRWSLSTNTNQQPSCKSCKHSTINSHHEISIWSQYAKSELFYVMMPLSCCLSVFTLQFPLKYQVWKHMVITPHGTTFWLSCRGAWGYQSWSGSSHWFHWQHWLVITYKVQSNIETYSDCRQYMGFNSLRLSDAIWHCGAWSSLVQVMAWRWIDQMNLQEQTLEEFQSKYTNFLWRKGIWKCHLQNDNLQC